MRPPQNEIHGFVGSIERIARFVLEDSRKGARYPKWLFLGVLHALPERWRVKERLPLSAPSACFWNINRRAGSFPLRAGRACALARVLTCILAVCRALATLGDLEVVGLPAFILALAPISGITAVLMDPYPRIHGCSRPQKLGKRLS